MALKVSSLPLSIRKKRMLITPFERLNPKYFAIPFYWFRCVLFPLISNSPPREATETEAENFRRFTDELSRVLCFGGRAKYRGYPVGRRENHTFTASSPCTTSRGSGARDGLGVLLHVVRPCTCACLCACTHTHMRAHTTCTSRHILYTNC